MNNGLPNSKETTNSNAERTRESVKHVVIVALALVSFGVGHQWSKSRPFSLPIPDAVAATNQVDSAKAPAPDALPQEETFEVREDLPPAAPAVPRKVERLSRAASEAPRHASGSEPTPLARQLVANLTQLEFNRGPLTPEQAARWKNGLHQLIQQGADAVPAIQEFLELNRDWDLGAANPLGYPSLRTALMDALDQIGGPEAQDLMLKTLETTSVPAEIARAARFLEQTAPGQYNEEIRAAARETLAQAATGQLSGWDVGPLFHVLQTYGSASAIPDLEKSAAKWNYYSALTLANLPSGEGIPALVRLAQEPTGFRGAAMEALAQVAVQHPAAGAALVELARAGLLTEKHWIAATSALEGNRYSIRNNGLDNTAAPIGSGARSYYLARSNQHLYSTPAWGGMSQEQIQRRVSIIDQLLAVNPSAAAAQALQQARASLLASSQQANAN